MYKKEIVNLRKTKDKKNMEKKKKTTNKIKK